MNAECFEIAGQSVGAAFVGCAAATLVLSEVLRTLNDGPRFEVMNLFLGSPQKPTIASNTESGPATNPGIRQRRYCHLVTTHALYQQVAGGACGASADPLPRRNRAQFLGTFHSRPHPAT